MKKTRQLWLVLLVAMITCSLFGQPAQRENVKTTKKTYLSNEVIVVQFEGFGGEGDWITIVPAAYPDEQYAQWFWTSKAREGQYTFDVLTEGKYEVRGYRNWPNGGYHVVARYAFVVTDPDKAAKGTERVSYSGDQSGPPKSQPTNNSVEGNSISVVAGTYGGNCNQPHGNKTSFLAEACNSRQSCNYVVDYKRIGDPAPGCAKDYVAQWQCGENSTIHETNAAPEAGYGSIVRLSCIEDRRSAPGSQPVSRSGLLPPAPERQPTFSGQVRSLFTNMENMPSRIWLDAKKPSAMPGRQIAIQVNVVNARNIPVPADRDF